MAQDPKVINGLIPIEETFQGGEAIQLTDARKVHEFLGVKKHFTSWFDYQSVVFKQGKDFYPKLGRSDKGRATKEYDITVEMAKHLAMMSRTERGQQARAYFTGIEKKYIEEVLKPQVVMGEETSKLFNAVLESVKQYSPTAAQTVGIKMLEAYGIEVPYNAHPLIVEERWSATQIGQELGVSNIRVGKTANELGLKRMPFAESRMSQALGDNHKQVSMYYYNQRAKDKIKNYLFPNQNLLN